MRIRLATPHDAAAIGDIRVAAWRQAYGAFMPAAFLAALDPSANLDALRLALESTPPPFRMTVAELDGACVGFAILGRPRYAAPESDAELWALNVRPAQWRSGVGRGLMSEALSQAGAQGFAAVELWCIEGNVPALHLYERCGFKRTGERRTTSSLTGHPLTELAYRRVF